MELLSGPLRRREEFTLPSKAIADISQQLDAALGGGEKLYQESHLCEI